MRSDTLKSAIILALIIGAMLIGLAATSLMNDSTVPPPKSYDVAMYDVYTDLLETSQQSWFAQLLEPRFEAVLIRVETESGQDHATEGRLAPEKRFKEAVDSAIADYLKRNSSTLELQKNFNLPHYDLITKAEEQAVLNEHVPGSACRGFQQKQGGYERWVELSAVGFNQYQTVAVVYLVEWRGGPLLCNGGIFGTGGYRMLQKRNGKWHLIENQVFSDWIT
jgi:hypothetical protein